MSAPTPLTKTGRVVLGLIASGVTRGYDMKTTVDRWTHHFWGASVGGLYPELRRLGEAGLVAMTDDPRGDQPRHAYALTDAGRHAWREWLESESPAVVELRHEGVLRLFFAEELGREGTARLLDRLAAQHRAVADGLATADVPPDQRASLGLLALEFGIDLHRFLATWCAERATALRAAD